jgi:hypothetical protein
MRSALKRLAVEARVVEDVAEGSRHGLVLGAFRLGKARTNVRLHQASHGVTTYAHNESSDYVRRRSSLLRGAWLAQPHRCCLARGARLLRDAQERR